MIPKFLANVRLELVNPALVKSMLTITGHETALTGKLDAVMDVIEALKASNPNATTLGDLLSDLNIDHITQLMSVLRKEPDANSQSMVICPHCGMVLNRKES